MRQDTARSLFLTVLAIPVVFLVAQDSVACAERMVGYLRPSSTGDAFTSLFLALMNLAVILLGVFPVAVIALEKRLRAERVLSLLAGWLFYMLLWDMVNLGIDGTPMRQVVKVALEILLVLGAGVRVWMEERSRTQKMA